MKSKLNDDFLLGDAVASLSLSRWQRKTIGQFDCFCSFVSLLKIDYADWNKSVEKSKYPLFIFVAREAFTFFRLGSDVMPGDWFWTLIELWGQSIKLVTPSSASVQQMIDSYEYCLLFWMKRSLSHSSNNICWNFFSLVCTDPKTCSTLARALALTSRQSLLNRK